MISTQIFVRYAEIQVLKGSAEFVLEGIGAGLGVACFDPSTQVAGAAFFMLPNSPDGETSMRPAQFVDRGLNELVGLMERLGADRLNMKLAFAGGARLGLEAQDQFESFDIGYRNVIALNTELEKLGIKNSGQETGGSIGRTLVFNVASGEVRINRIVGGTLKLTNLREG